MWETESTAAIYAAFMSEDVKDYNLKQVNLVDTTDRRQPVDRVHDRIASMLGLLADAITPQDALSGSDASGGTVTSLTEAVMGVSAGLVLIANAIAGLKDG